MSEARLPNRCPTCGWLEPSHIRGCIVGLAEENRLSYETDWLESDSAEPKPPTEDTASEETRILRIIDTNVKDVWLKAKLFKAVLEG